MNEEEFNLKCKHLHVELIKIVSNYDSHVVMTVLSILLRTVCKFNNVELEAIYDSWKDIEKEDEKI